MNSLISQSLHTCQLMANEFVEKDKNRNLLVFSQILYFMGFFVSLFIKKTKRQSKKVSRQMKKNVCVWRDITRLRLQPHSPKPLSFCIKYLKSIVMGFFLSFWFVFLSDMSFELFQLGNVRSFFLL